MRLALTPTSSRATSVRPSESPGMASFTTDVSRVEGTTGVAEVDHMIGGPL